MRRIGLDKVLIRCYNKTMATTKTVQFLIEGEILEQREGTTLVRVINGFGNPEIYFAPNTILREVPK